MQLVLDSNDLLLKKRNDCFWVANKSQSRLISPHKISSIAVLADCTLSTAVIRLAAKHEIPILFFSRTGKVESRLWSPQFGSIATIRRQQVFFAASKAATDWIIELYQLKAKHQIQNLDYLKNRKKAVAEELINTKTFILKKSKDLEKYAGQTIPDVRNQLLGTEGIIAKAYWEATAKTLPEPWTFKTRNRRPATDFFNAALNYSYGMLYSQVEGALFAAGLDPYLGIFHADEYNKPTFTYDLIEPFRPWVDRLLIESCLQGKMKRAYFENKNKGIWISKKGKQFLIPTFNDWIAKNRLFDHKRLSTKNHLHRFAGLFAQKLKVL